MLTELVSYNSKDEVLKDEADFVHFLSMDISQIPNPNFARREEITPQINDISFASPPFALLPQRHLVEDDSIFCNASTVSTDCKTNYCQCPHVIQVSKYHFFHIFASY